jgi:hypothetical protein
MIVERFQPEHLAQIDLQPAQAAARAALTAQYIGRLLEGPAATMRDDTGRIVACAGVVDFSDGSLLWAFLAADCRRHMVAIVRGARRLVQVAQRPVWATAACDFAPGCRLLQMLGFERQPEPVEGVSADDKPHYVFERTA